MFMLSKNVKYNILYTRFAIALATILHILHIVDNWLHNIMIYEHAWATWPKNSDNLPQPDISERPLSSAFISLKYVNAIHMQILIQ